MRHLRHARLRLRLTAAAFVLSLLITAGAVIALVTVLQHQAVQTITTRLHDRATALAATVIDHHTGVDVIGTDDALFDGANWVYNSAGTRIEGSTSIGALAPVLAQLSKVRTTQIVVNGPWHLRAQPVVSGEQVTAVIVTGVNDGPYTETITSIGRAAVLLGTLAVLGATALTWVVLARSLGPIATMTDQAAGWSRTHSDGRFALGPPKDEIGRLAAVLDDLLDRVDAALAAERRLTAEIAHELRTPLTLLTGEAQLALMDRDLNGDQRVRFERIQNAADTMARAITTLLADAAAVAERDADADVATVLHDVTASLDFRGAVKVSGRTSRIGVPAAVVERILAPVLTNAAGVASSEIRVDLASEEGSAVIRVQDDGPGVDTAIRTSLFTAGVTTREGGTGIGLALARRLARDAGGEVALLRPRPATFEIRLPLVSG